MGIYFPTKYQAYKARCGDEVVVRCDGGYLLLSAADYRVWRSQR